MNLLKVSLVSIVINAKKYGHYQSKYKSHIQCRNCKRYGYYSRGRVKRPEHRENHIGVAQNDNVETLLLAAHDSNESDNSQ